MSPQIYIRPLVVEDAATSYKWRNNSDIWRFTKFNRTNEVTLKIEADWLVNTLVKDDEKRFAICLKENDQYIGNIQLLNIKNRRAEFHLFIGEPEFWGKGIGKQATILILDYAFNELFVESVSLEVNEDNIPALTIYKNMGFIEVTKRTEFIEMLLSKEMFHYKLNSNN